ncbi:tetratricopeptide repeat protein [Erythrobacter alti]|uniref:tetratricopeptide repeat protein n=1 Tax=Erythrobacter alti TaxID=1896145 RepID=UPI0030F37EDC
MAIALAGGAALGAAATAPAAYAQDHSSGFVEAYQPVAQMTQGETPNHAGARAQIEAVFAAIETPDDRMAAGNLALIIGQNLNDDVLRRRGIDTMLASGKVAPEQLGQFHWYSANFAYNAGDYAVARQAIERALANGYVDSDSEPGNDPEYVMHQSYVAEGNPAAGVAYIKGIAETRFAAGQAVPERWLLRALQDSLDNNLTQQATEMSALVARHYPTQRNWTNAVQILNAYYELEPAARIDLFRLMQATNTITTRGELFRFAEDLDPRIMGNEVLSVLQHGVQNGVIDTGDAYYTELTGIATPRAATDRRQVSTYVAEGESGDALDALATGDVLYSLDDYAQAQRFYELALERGGNPNTAHTRMGITHAMQGNYAAAKDHFSRVTGDRAPIANLWSIYADQQMAQ